VADAAVRAYRARRPATLWAAQIRLPSNVRIDLSNNFPTTDDNDQPAAVDPKLGILQARAADGTPIATVMSLAAHNQEVGHDIDSTAVSADWPGVFHRRVEATLGGTAVYLVADNGSQEDPERTDVTECRNCWDRPAAVGTALADAVVAAVPTLERAAPGPVHVRRDEFFVPLENNLFKAAAAAGIFGDRQTYIAGVPAGKVGNDLRTEVSVVDLGPDVELLGLPGEAFPALALGSHWGVDEASCPDRPNPPVPVWQSPARFRFPLGLADDMLGYLSPAWGFSTQPGVYVTTCFDDQDDRDPRGHQHKLETESVGPSGGNLVAEHLAALARGAGPGAEVEIGRYVLADGTLSRRPLGAVAVWLAGTGEVIAVGHGGAFVDFDGVAQATPDLTTSGVRTGGRRPRTVYVDVYPAVQEP
jgi:hypothetical protein